MRYIEIQIKGEIDKQWSSWFEGLDITHTELNETMLTGSIRDQAELYGLFAKLRDLGLSLRSVNYVDRNVEQECSNQTNGESHDQKTE